MIEPAAVVCKSCERPVKDQAYACQACADRLSRALAEVPALIADLRTSRARQARLGGAATGVLSRSFERPLPWNEHASEATEILKSTLVSWCRLVLDERGGPLPADNLASVALWLLGQVEWLRHHPDADEAIDEITHAVGRARHVIDRAPGRVYAGPCREEWGDETAGEWCCTASLYAKHGAHEVVCEFCTAEHNVEARRVWLLESSADQLCTAADLSRFLTAYGEPITAERIRKWVQRGQLAPHGTDHRSRPVYRVGDATEALAKYGDTRMQQSA